MQNDYILNVNDKTVYHISEIKNGIDILNECKEYGETPFMVFMDGTKVSLRHYQNSNEAKTAWQHKKLTKQFPNN